MRVYSGTAWAAAYIPAAGYLALSGGTMTGAITFAAGQAVASASVNGILSSTDWTTFNGKQAALGFTPYNSTNPAGYTTNLGTVTSVSGTGTVSGLTLSGTVTSSGSLTLGGSITGFLPTAGGTMTGNIVFNAGQFGTNVNTFLSTPSSANLAAALTDETGSGAAVFATSPTLVTPVLGTPTSGNLSSCTVDGTNSVGYKNIPKTGSDKTSAYTLVTGDVGKYVGVGTSGSIVVPTSTFANGDAISVFNNTTGNITITTSAPTAYIGGTNTVKTSITLATRGIATILFVSATVCVVTGNVS
jgi:hypothetical protein